MVPVLTLQESWYRAQGLYPVRELSLVYFGDENGKGVPSLFDQQLVR
jgi:hypothetical protein